MVALFIHRSGEGKEQKSHFCVVNDTSRLFSGKRKVASGTPYGKVLFCRYCNKKFSDLMGKRELLDGVTKRVVIRRAKELLEDHEPKCENVRGEGFVPEEILPKTGNNTCKFKNYHLLFKSDLRIYADFECALVIIYEQVGEKTVRVQRHKVVSFAKRFCSEIAGMQFEPIYYAGKFAAKVFVKTIRNVAYEIGMRFPSAKPQNRTVEEVSRWRKKMVCFACKEPFVDGDPNLQKVFDHCHTTGRYRSAMHSLCNLSVTMGR